MDCTFDETTCGYSVSNTSTSFAFSYVFSIASLGENVVIIFAAVRVYRTEWEWYCCRPVAKGGGGGLERSDDPPPSAEMSSFYRRQFVRQEVTSF